MDGFLTPALERSDELLDRASSKVNEQIVGGSLQPEQRMLPKREMCDMSGLGRTAASEVMHNLATNGLLEDCADDGTYITSPSTASLAEFASLLVLTAKGNWVVPSSAPAMRPVRSRSSEVQGT